MAPPLTLVRSRSRPSSFSTARYWPAKASFTSTRSMSLTESDAASSALRDAGTGPMPMISGGTPATAHDTTRASGLRDRAPRFVFVGDHEGGRAVHDPAGVARGDEAVLAERGLEGGQPLERGVRAQVIVLLDADRLASLGRVHGHDLVLEHAPRAAPPPPPSGCAARRRPSPRARCRAAARGCPTSAPCRGRSACRGAPP